MAKNKSYGKSVGPWTVRELIPQYPPFAISLPVHALPGTKAGKPGPWSAVDTVHPPARCRNNLNCVCTILTSAPLWQRRSTNHPPQRQCKIKLIPFIGLQFVQNKTSHYVIHYKRLLQTNIPKNGNTQPGCYMLMLVSMTLTLMQGHSESVKQRCMHEQPAMVFHAICAVFPHACMCIRVCMQFA